LTAPGDAAPAPGADTVFFLSDYGRQDELVGVVHAVLRRLAPRAVVVDLTHDVPAFDVRAGAAALSRALPYLGPGVVLAVVDPGVGGDRRAVALQVPGPGPRWLVGPDNGLLVPAARAAGGVERAVGLPASDPRPGRAVQGPATFDGRDRFAPAVTAICDGADLAALGVSLGPTTLVEAAEPVNETRTLDDGRHRLRAEVTWVDRFGNVQLAAAGDVIPGAVREVSVTVRAGRGDPGPLPRVRTFSDLSPGQPGLLVDANGRLALVVREGSAAARFGLVAGAMVEAVW
jgi:S-adenosyl-L-methionine hydrolase (adenosine-forming)